MEAIAIIGCIAAVVSAYHDGGAIVDKIKQKRLARKAPPPTRLLEESLAKGPQAVEDAKANGIERFGSRYAVGDKIALDSLKDILIHLQGSLIRHLRQAQEDDNMTDFTTLVDASDIGRIKTVTVLNELYLRMTMAATVGQAPVGNLGSFTPPQVASQNEYTTPNVNSLVPSSPPLHSSERNTSQAGDDIATSPRHQDTLLTSSPEHQAARRTTPKPGFFDRFKRKFSSEESGPSRDSARSSNIRSENEAQPHSNPHRKTLSPSPMVSSQASIDEENPWVSESSSQPTSVREPAPDTSMSRASTLLASIRQRPSTISSASSASHERMLSPSLEYGGFCKGAYRLQVHNKEAMKLRNQSVAKTGEAYYWACCSSKCAFEGPARRERRVWAYDDTVRDFPGVRYRWSFLAKAHIALSKVKNGVYDYGCVFCIYDQFECPVFHGIKEFLEHVGTHRDKSIADTMLERIKCVKDRVADLAEDFDINLLPVEAQPEPTSTHTTNSLAEPNMMNVAASDQGSWRPNGEDMADVDPWRDAI
ncbi:MAG: hypothetical protein Q9201_003254 [Fulgogasparrea decipioides]